ncbi:GTP cyclohydrolase II protein [Pseudoalteromonas tunicata D2]|uniref:GTP cyclohydrolase II protein n=1 Tax=Pseudoalteromonas tunicata D2 TaxID=87626 RepID=A4CCF3_9GAMM|nr:GTP cyclohydrolase II protein [Pseudoalteromonas tunicata D2]
MICVVSISGASETGINFGGALFTIGGGGKRDIVVICLIFFSWATSIVKSGCTVGA